MFGTRSKGAALAARAFLMQDDSLPLLADVAVGGERVERVGVTPHLEMPSALLHAGSKDPRLDAATSVLARQAGNDVAATGGAAPLGTGFRGRSGA